ncbi:MAG: toxin-antitoxin system TumE family protein [Rhodanobacter sp.]
MKARLLLREHQSLTETAFIEVVIRHVPKPVSGSGHDYKYSMVLVAEGACVLCYDNEAGKGDHKHVADREVAYRFTDLDTLQTDFWNDVDAWRAAQ